MISLCLRRKSAWLIGAGRKSDVIQGEVIEVIRTAVERLDVASDATRDALSGLRFQVQQNSSQLALLDSSISGSLDEIKGAVARTEGLVRNLDQSLSGTFTVVQSDMHSMASSSLVTSQAVTEMLAKMDAFSAQMSGLVSRLLAENVTWDLPC